MTLCQTPGSEKKNPESPCPNGRARRRSPGPDSGAGRAQRPGGIAGRVRRPSGTPRDDGSAPYSWCEKNRKTQQKGKTKTTERSDPNTLAASHPEEGPQKSSRRIPKTRGAQNGTPRKTPRSRTHGQKGRTNKCGGTKKGTRKNSTSACGGVPCYYLSFLSLKKQPKGDDGGKNQKKREQTPKIQDLT